MNSPELTALEMIRQRWLFIHCGIGAPPSAKTRVAPSIEKIDTYVDQYMAQQTWEPGNPEHGNPCGKLPVPGVRFGTDVFTPMYKFAIAWRCPFSRHSQQPELLERIIAGLRYGERFVRPGLPKEGGWYSWDIAFPGAICNTLLLCDDQLPTDLRRLLIEDLADMPARVFKLDRLKGICNRPVASGSNDLAVLYGGMLRGLILKDPQWLNTVIAQLPVAMGRADSTGEGLQTDWSYHFHGHGINVGYGAGSINVQGQWIYLMQDTPWQVPDSIRELHVGMIREFFGRNVWRGRNAPYSLDRAIAIPRSIYDSPTATMFGLATGDFPPPDKAVFAAAAKDYFLGVDPDGKPGSALTHEFVTAMLLSRVEQPVQADLSVLGGMRYYPESDYLLVREPEWFAAVRMSSARTKAWNSMLGFNIQCSSGAEFSIAFMTDGREFDHTTITTMNWKRMMGVTRCDAIEGPPECYARSEFCGGLAGDEFSVLGLQYLLAPADQDTLRANKSLFVTPDAMILLGSKIRCDSDEPVVTTLFHAPLVTDGPYLHNHAPLNVQTDGVWEIKAGSTLYLRNVGIRLLTDAQLIIETRQGSYADLNMPQVGSGQTREHPDYHTVNERRWVYLLVNHGVRPQNGRYGALLFPLAKPDQLPAAETFEILHDDLHHKVAVENGAIGGEVRFPGDWRKKIGLSYWGAEQHQWGSIARWVPGDDADHAQLEMLPPRRFIRDNTANTEIFLPDGFEQENVTLKTYAGTPFPANLMSLPAKGQVLKLRVRRTT